MLEKQEKNTEAWQQVHMEDPERRQEEQEKILQPSSSLSGEL